MVSLLTLAWMEVVTWAVSSSEVGQEAGWRGQVCWEGVSMVPHWRDWVGVDESHGVLVAELWCKQGDLAHHRALDASSSPSHACIHDVACWHVAWWLPWSIIF